MDAFVTTSVDGLHRRNGSGRGDSGRDLRRLQYSGGKGNPGFDYCIYHDGFDGKGVHPFCDSCWKFFQGLVTLLARLIEPFMTEAALSNLSFVGSVLLFCVGVNLVWAKGEGSESAAGDSACGACGALRLGHKKENRLMKRILLTIATMERIIPAGRSRRMKR